MTGVAVAAQKAKRRKRANSIHVFEPPVLRAYSARGSDDGAEQHAMRRAVAQSEHRSDNNIFSMDFALEQEWMRSFKRMRRGIAASDDNSAQPEEFGRAGEMAGEGKERDRDWQIAKLQDSIRKTRDKAILK